ncbi:hypothetical protein B0T16DRAFT_456571 [Cercophora newfieldiana]|uniref:F-box domain-containing protein n=1 Tax=Cercophora newfieldiana TaxID=92897 RepID=A0AA40CRW5_9PEZI|nr:hypothetical protein B0T16DRAFT_456571 [Cercophora newfieldiana]
MEIQPPNPDATLARLPRDIIYHLTTYLNPTTLLTLARACPHLTGYLLHLLRHRDGTLGTASLYLQHTLRHRNTNLLTSALAYNALAASALLSPTHLIAGVRAGDIRWTERLLFAGVDVNGVETKEGSDANETALSVVLRAADAAGGRRCPLALGKLLVKMGAYLDERGATTKLGENEGEGESPIELVLKQGRHRCAAHYGTTAGGNSCLRDLVAAMVRKGGINLKRMDKKRLERGIMELGVEDRVYVWQALWSVEGSPLGDYPLEVEECEVGGVEGCKVEEVDEDGDGLMGGV